MKKYKCRWEKEKKYVKNILTLHRRGEGKTSRRMAYERALALNGNTICKKMFSLLFRG